MNTPTSTNPLTLLGRSWWILLVYGLFAVAYGIFALTRPIAAAAALTWAIGVLALAEGVIGLLALFGTHAVSKVWQALYAIASIVFGLLAIANPLAAAQALVLLLAAWLVVAGIYRIAFAIRVRKHVRGEWLIILSGVLAIALGAMFAMNPLSGLVIIKLWIGAFALIYGIVQIVAAFRIRRLKALA
jgi:uncharacterized membrane protein HdeD (DUF308 family)